MIDLKKCGYEGMHGNEAMNNILNDMNSLAISVIQHEDSQTQLDKLERISEMLDVAIEHTSLEMSPPKPRTKVEYVLCEFSSLSDLVLACENGDILYLEHVETKEKKKTDVYGAISTYRHNDPIYRKVEREIEWHEDIPAGGVLCYASDAIDDYKLVISIVGYKDSLLSKFVDNSGGNWRTATPLTKAEIQKLMDNAPE